MPPKIASPWTTESISILIEAYSQNNCLYDTKLPVYHNKHIRQKALMDIALTLEPYRPNTTWQEVKVKIAALRTQFGVEHNKVKTSSKSGTGTDDIYVPSLWYYNSMLFLQKHITPRKSIETPVSQMDDFPKEVQYSLFEIDNLVEEQDTVTVEVEELMGCSEDSFAKHNIDEENMTPRRTSSAPLWLSDDVPATKKKKVTIDNTLKKSEEALSNIAKALAVPSVTPLDNASHSLSQFISSSLQSIKNPSLKIETTKTILNILMDAQLKDIC